MRIRSFIALIVTGAVVICAVAYLGRSGDSRPAVVGPARHGEAPVHAFVPRNDSEGRIACPLTSLDGWASAWSKRPPLCSLDRGWTQAQSWGVWATGLASTITIHLDSVGPRELVVEARANPDLPAGTPQALRLSANGHRVDRQLVPRRWRQLRFHLPAEVLEPGTNELSLEFEASISPEQVGKSTDYRTLAAAVKEIAVLATGSGAAHDRSSHLSRRLWDPGRGSFGIQHSGTLVLPIEVPEGAREVRIDLAASRSVDVGDTEVVVAVEDLDGGGRRQVAVDLEPWPGVAQAVLDAGHLAGRWAIVTVDTTLGTGQLDVSPVEVVAGDRKGAGTQATSPLQAAIGGPGSSDRPDIVLITLDAARADHFSFAGYPRETTPNIDRLAAESLVFTDVYALAPYTLCSVPTMITGLSFLDHGVVTHEDVLSDDAVTLAEHLKDLGYHTACFSATPNNSKAKNFDQGYDVFREMWTEGPRNQTRRAYFIAKQVADWLKAEDPGDDRPLHLQVHMVPPHAPYDPPEAFDVFSDPDYEGPCAGYAKTLNGLDGGTIAPAPNCLEHLLDLYDGNLRTADQATRIILDALRRRPRWRDTVVLVVSDHGEAFYEHGRMEHNSTVFTEMMHVPFVLRLPPGWDRSAVRTDGLATLADIVPTLVAAAGGRPPTLTEGVNLLAGADRSGRHLVCRTAETRPTIGARTLRWSMLLNPGGSGALYDLAADPGELDNRWVTEGARYAGLGLILTERVGRPPRIAASAESASITDEERALLETLGYVN